MKVEKEGKQNPYSEIGKPITNLQTHLKNLERSKSNIKASQMKTGFDLEFEYIEQKSQEYLEFPASAANKEENLDKNRYTNVKPPDSTRVVLRECCGKPGSDFVNANFIKGTHSEIDYISAQGPMDHTVSDFWRMIWEKNVYVIVMLTKDIENGRVKCSRYWPDSDPKEIEDLRIETCRDARHEEKELIKQLLKVTYLKTKESRIITHFQYTGWPDFGLPPSTKAFIQLVKQVNEANIPKQGPIAVHCSAGIGRSGTFCTVHMNMQKLQEHFKNNFDPPTLNIVNDILELRKQRPGMVQTKEQFIFCYKAIFDEYMRLWKDAKRRKLQSGQA